MSRAITYANVPGLDLAAERKKIDFPVNLEVQTSVKRQITSGFYRISADPNNAGNVSPIGEVPIKRPHIPYGDAMDWAVKEFEEIGIPFKLRVSAIDRKNCNLYQEYLFDQAVAPPDGEGISPMVLLHGSYVKGPPLALYLGTYRYVCSNGAIVSAGGKTRLSVNSHNWGSLKNNGFHDEFRDAFAHYADVSAFYARLSRVPLAETADAIFKSKLIPFCIRKKVICRLAEDGLAEVISEKPDDEKYKALTEADLATPGLLIVNGGVSAWDVYNRFTDIGSKLASSDRVLIAGKSVDRVFRGLFAAA